MRLPGLCPALVAVLLALPSLAPAQTQTPPAPPAATFTNPLLPSGPDPWVIREGGFYYYTATTGRNLTLWRTPDITDLANAEKKVVWTPEPGKPYSSEVWAPELHRWGKTWALYFAADAKENTTHRVFVIENDSPNPLEGQWSEPRQVSDATNKWAIDADQFEVHGRHYLLWAGWPGDSNGEQDIYIAHLKDPATIDSPRTLITKPTYEWEKHGDLPEGKHLDVNEGPEALLHGGKVWVIFSASACWMDYKLGAVWADEKANLLDAASWHKLDHPVFVGDPAHGVYAPGHNGFFKSPDGKQDWIIYHANDQQSYGCGPRRAPRIQSFTWNADGSPNFGIPVPAGVPLAKPSGTR